MIKLNKRSESTTIYDVAERANVSVSTVSKILNNTQGKFKEETRNLVFKSAEVLGYTRHIRTKEKNKKISSNNIVVIMPDIINPFYASLANGLESTLRNSGMNMMFHNSHNSRVIEVDITKQCINSSCKGVIIISIAESYKHIEDLINSGVKVVAFEQHIDLNCNKVGFNFKKGGFMATEFLVQSGHKEIGFISSPLSRSSRVEIFKGYKKALGKYNLPICEKFIKIAVDEDRDINEMYDYENGIEQVINMIGNNELPEAIFCINDMTAIGVIRKLQDEGYNIPNDISVIGFDNINFSYVIKPELTTIEQSTYELGAMAAEILLGSINDCHRGNISIIIEPKLIVRESVLIKSYE